MKMPPYDIAKVMATKRLLTEKGQTMVGRVLQAEDLNHLAERISDNLPGHPAHDVVLASILDFAGRELKQDRWEATAWRLAGNMARLSQGYAAPPWHGQTVDEWCPVQVESVDCQERAQGPGATVVLRVLAGLPAGMTCKVSWSLRFIRRLAKTSLGFSKFGHTVPERVFSRGEWIVKGFPFFHAREICRMRFWGLFVPNTSAELKLGQVEGSSGFRTGWNRRILRARTHLEPPCPRGFKHPCWACPVGYLSCTAGCHQADWVAKQCSRCGKEAWHDPAYGPESSCIACRAKAK